jgi:hypothetical protein
MGQGESCCPRPVVRLLGVAVFVLGCVAAKGQTEQRKAPRQYPAATFGSSLVLPHALRGDIYHLPIDTRELPDFRKLTPAGRVYATTLSVPQQAFTSGFPGVTSRYEWFAIDYHGDIFIDKRGSYMFELTSDDGSVLYIDGKRIIDNDGLHQAVSARGAAKLQHGLHHLRVSYFQGPRFEVMLRLEVAGPKEKWHLFSMAEFTPRDEPGAAAPQAEEHDARGAAEGRAR